MTIAPPGVCVGLDARNALRRGINQLAEAVRPTLGPTPRTVAVQDVVSGRPIEVLDDAATILRRIIDIPDVAAEGTRRDRTRRRDAMPRLYFDWATPPVPMMPRHTLRRAARSSS
jgi:hypothetical protein